MAGAVLDHITNIINSPPGVIAAGGVLFGIVYKFFERVESVINEDTKLEIAIWLLGVRSAKKIQGWPRTFARVFDQVFGTEHFSLQCFWRSSIASLAGVCISFVIHTINLPLAARASFFRALFLSSIPGSLGTFILLNVVPDYISLLESRFLLFLMQKSKWQIVNVALLIADFYMTVIIGLVAASLFTFVRFSMTILLALLLQGHIRGDTGAVLATTVPATLRLALTPRAIAVQIVFFGFLFVLPALFTSLWLWLYVGSGLVLKAARRFDIGFAWFNRHFDIEKKPLQSIGLIAGTLVACLYWFVVLVRNIPR